MQGYGEMTAALNVCLVIQEWACTRSIHTRRNRSTAGRADTLRAGHSGGATYLGDARLAAFPPSERRMLSYAVDGKVTVDRSSEEQHAIVKAAIAQGVMRLTRLARQITTYRLKAAGDGEHRLLIEHPRPAGWGLANPRSDGRRAHRRCLSHPGDAHRKQAE